MEECICLFCSEQFTKRKDSNINKFCSKSCNAKYHHAQRALLKPKNFCKSCNNEIASRQLFCSRSCSARYNNAHRIFSGYTCKNKTKQIICKVCGEYHTVAVSASNSTKCCNCKLQPMTKICRICDKAFLSASRSRSNTCSPSCLHILRSNASSNAGRISAQKSCRRSKNEILFAEKCQQLGKVITNVAMFNGWDADIILPEYKVAILWNGVWHHRQITHKHSVKQVQNRDKIKIKEINAAGFIPYIINDLGSENPEFVEEMFVTFTKWMRGLDSNQHKQ